MNVKDLILEYQYSEKIKSQLIIGSNLLVQMEALRGEERAGAERIVKTYLESLRTEIRIARKSVHSISYHGAEKSITESLGRLEMNDVARSNSCLAQALSYITTSCQAAMANLQASNLL